MAKPILREMLAERKFVPASIPDASLGGLLNVHHTVSGD